MGIGAGVIVGATEVEGVGVTIKGAVLFKSGLVC